MSVLVVALGGMLLASRSQPVAGPPTAFAAELDCGMKGLALEMAVRNWQGRTITADLTSALDLASCKPSPPPASPPPRSPPSRPRSAEGTVIFVSVTGDDATGTGAIGSPFASLGKARDQIRGLPKDRAGATTVSVRAGTYYEALELTAEDSGPSADRPVRYTAHLGEAVTLSGGRPLALHWQLAELEDGSTVFEAALPKDAPANFTGL